MLSATDGLCQCGCGEKTSIAQRTRLAFGHVKGQPVRFRPGHHTRGRKLGEVRDYITPEVRAALDDADLLRRLIEDEGLRVGDVAKRLKTRREHVSAALDRHGIARRKGGRPVGIPAHNADPLLTDPGWLRRQYVDLGRTTTEIATARGVSGVAVSRWLRKHDIPARPAHTRPRLVRVWAGVEVTNDVRRHWRERGSFVSEPDYEQLLAEAGGRCVACDRSVRRDVHWDHIWPISDWGTLVPAMVAFLASAPPTLATFVVALAVLDRTNRGTTETENLQPLCQSCNQAKHARRLADLPAEWWGYGAGGLSAARIAGSSSPRSPSSAARAATTSAR